jgi:tight adherence protein C
MMFGSSAEFLIGLAATTLAFAGLCFFAYDASATRERLRDRVSPLARARERLARASGGRAIRAPGTPNQLTGTRLRGDELEFARRLVPLHIPPSVAPWLFWALRPSAGLVVGAALVLLGYDYFEVRAIPSLGGLGLLGAALGWSSPHFVVGRLALHRRRAIARGLADAIELLVISVEAGLSLEDAINRIVGELRRSQPAMAEELAVTGADLQILPNRDDALRRLAERVNLPSVHSVVTTLSQTLRYGTPLVQALRVVAAELRDDDLLRLEKQANRMPVLLTIPMIVFILPSIFLIIGGPAFLKILDVLAGMG